jgi:hypothetical protein
MGAVMTEPQLREIQGFLDAFEQLNHGPDRECCFEFERVEWAGDLLASLEAHLDRLPGSHPHWQLTTEKMPKGVEGLRPVLESWFFGATFGGVSGMAPQIALDCRRTSVGQLLRFLADFFGGEHPRVWRAYLHAPEEPADSSTADNFILERQQHVYWLHLDCSE